MRSPSMTLTPFRLKWSNNFKEHSCSQACNQLIFRSENISRNLILALSHQSMSIKQGPYRRYLRRQIDYFMNGDGAFLDRTLQIHFYSLLTQICGTSQQLDKSVFNFKVGVCAFLNICLQEPHSIDSEVLPGKGRIRVNVNVFDID